MDGMSEVFESVARYFSVLGEPTRLRILHLLCRQEMCVNDILKSTHLAQANVSRHLGLMYQAGMVSRRRDGTQVFYRVADTVHVDLCRTVSAQVASRADGISISREGEGQVADEPSALQGVQPEGNRQVPPANQKEEASV